MQYLREYGSTVLIVLVGALVIYKMAVGGPHPLDGKAAPDFTLPNVDGTPVSLSSHLGKEVVVLDFWASWCPPCRKGLPVLDSLAKSLKGQPVAIYAINIRESKALVSEFARLEKLTLPILLDDTGLVADDYGVTTIPQTVIIDRAGNVHKVVVGLSMWGAEESLLAEIRAALDIGTGTPGV